jgi:nitrogen-specific signal transduction histidine kinase
MPRSAPPTVSWPGSRDARAFHDLKNHLAALQGCAWLLGKSQAREEDLKLLDCIGRVVDKLEAYSADS